MTNVKNEIKNESVQNDISKNVDYDVIKDFGSEWELYDQSTLSDAERKQHFDAYFSVFPWDELSPDAVGFDAGCGTGRWAYLVAPKVHYLHCVDPSKALNIAKKNLQSFSNCSFHNATVDHMPFPDESMDFGYSLGVLHHIPDTRQAMIDCVKKLKKGSPFLLYLYYAFDNQPVWFKFVWKCSDIMRRIISHMPKSIKLFLTQVIALVIYYPMGRTAKILENIGFNVHSWPLSVYRNRSFYSMRTDTLDRFGTKLENRFTKIELKSMMEEAGLERIKFSDKAPFWCVVGYKR